MEITPVLFRKYSFSLVLLAILVFSLIPNRSVIAQSAGGEIEPWAGNALCLPGVYIQVPSDGCLPFGPSDTITELARQGLPYPQRPLPARIPDTALSIMDYIYISVSNEYVPLYSSLEDAMAGSASGSLTGRMKYLVNFERVENEFGVFYRLPSGQWINGGEAGAACCITYGRFQGLLFRRTPPNAFGWILTTTPVKSAPGYNSPDTGRQLYRENLVQVYAVSQADNATWIMIGAGEWIEDRVIGRVTPNPVPPAGVENGRWIEINLEEQVVSVYEDSRMVFATLVATGIEPFYTRPGLFQIYVKKEAETMQGSFEADRSDFYYLQNVPWTMYFDEARALHGAYWHALFGYPQSHGCVNLSPGDSHWLFDWATEGDWVYVWDPSGKTPTDPSLYTPGGA